MKRSNPKIFAEAGFSSECAPDFGDPTPSRSDVSNSAGHVRRREFSALLVGLVAFMSQAHAEEPVHRIAVLVSMLPPDVMHAWLEGLRGKGYVIGRNLQIEYRF